jgi:hypothetical protein
MSLLFGQELSEHYTKQRELTADNADKYHLYQLSVQSPGADIRFLYLLYRILRKRRARHFRDDFSGTCLLVATWVNMGVSHTAEGFDNDPEPLEWGRKHNLDPLGDVASRASQHVADVREPSNRPPDIRCGQNFSYWFLTERKALLEYFKCCYIDLAEHGLLFIDIHGGPLAIADSEDLHETDYGFSYVWKQSGFSPVTGIANAEIRFKFRDGTEMRDAFVYKWRVWTLPEVTDLLYEAGFSKVICYWRDSGKDDGDGQKLEGYWPTERGYNDPTWVAYIAALN